MSAILTPPRRRSALALAGGAVAIGLGAALAPVLLVALLVPGAASRRRCGAGAPAAPGIALAGAGGGTRVGASEYGGPGDPSSGQVGASGVDLDAHPDSYAELGGTSFATATAIGGLAYETPLRISWGGRSAIGYKRDIGLGGGLIDGLPRVIDLWWQLARALGIPYENGEWSGPVRIARAPATGAGNVLGASVSDGAPAALGPGAGTPGAVGPLGAADGEPACAPTSAGLLALAPGSRARLEADGQAAAPVDAPAAVKAMIAAGNAIAGAPYLYGGGHGLPLDVIAPAYDCSSSVSHLLWGGGLLSVADDEDSTELESFGAPGPGRWVTIYASPRHVFLYVAGLRWDTHNAAGPDDGSAGIGWHPLVRSSAGFVARHPTGL